MKFISLCNLCLLCASLVITQAQRTQPDLSQLEPEVREHIKQYQDALATSLKDPNSSETKLAQAYGALAEIYQAYSLNAPARESYLNASKLAPKDFRWIYLLAKLDQLEGRADDAVQRFRIVTSLQPDFIPALVNLGNVYLELNRLDDAKSSFSSALQKVANNPAAHYGLGQVALSRRSYAEAVEQFEKALAVAPEANRIHYALAMAYRGLRNSEKTKFHLAQQGTVGVRVADPLLDRLQELVQGARVHLVRGKMALEAKRYEEAARELRKAIEAQPDSVPAHINLGAALTQLKDLKGAAEQFEKALLIDPNNVNAHHNLAVLLAHEKKHEQAIVHLEKVLSLQPTDLGARFFLSQQLLYIGRAEEALKLANSLYSSSGSVSNGLLVLSALLKLKRCDEAAALQQKLIAKAVEERNEELQTKLKANLCQP